MSTRPSDSAIAQAFWSLTPSGDSDVRGTQLVELARVIDATRTEQDAELSAEHAEVLQSIPRPDDSGERCESALPDCGPVEFWDSEGVPLCSRCYSELETETKTERRARELGISVVTASTESTDDMEDLQEVAILRDIEQFAYRMGYHELGYDPIDALLRRLASTPMPSDDARVAMGALFGESMSAFSQLTTKPQADQDRKDAELQAEIDRLNAIINSPQSGDFLRAVSTEAEHQRQRWPSDHDAGKTPPDWFWLVGYVAGKALRAHLDGDIGKAEHHAITTAAVCANWHRAMLGLTNMRPGIDGDAAMAQEAGNG